MYNMKETRDVKNSYGDSVSTDDWLLHKSCLESGEESIETQEIRLKAP